MRHIISILLENEAGALSRVSGLFSARGYNIESLTVAPTDDETMSRITVVTDGSDNVIEQIEKQLNKLVDVVKVLDLTADEHIEREIVLLKLNRSEAFKPALEVLSSEYGGMVVDASGDTVVVEITGAGEKLDRAIQSVPREAIRELVRSGALGIATGNRAIHKS
ncbi:MAG: acetolactate synthase small subunit [Gammaproteobacteria bacterium]|nr:acetolactate synthase small subunit [Gammaproteobacteria bacterium]